jgi:signal transduction histidine kinase
MNMDRQATVARVVAWLIVMVATVALLLTLWLQIRGANSGELIALVFVVLFGVLGIVGTLIVRRARNQIGWIFVAIAVGATGAGLAGALTDLSTLYAVPWTEWWSWWNDTGFVVAMFALPLLFLLFPDGHLPSPGWRWVSRVYGLGVAISLVWLLTGQETHGVFRNPTYVPWSPLAYGLLLNVGGTLAFGAALASIGALIVRYRRSVGEERLQMRWVVTDVAFGAVWLVLGMIVRLLPVSAPIQETISNVAWTVMFMTLGIGLPVAVTLAVFKYRLYELDVVINKTLLYVGLVGFITAVYVAIVVGIGSLVGSGDQANVPLSIAATAIVAVAFQPVRERVQRFANRLVYGQRATPYEVLSEFSERIGDAYDAEDLLPRMARILAEATGAQRSDVWLVVGGRLRPDASWPADVVPLDALPLEPFPEQLVAVRHQDELLGALSLEKRPGESLSATEQSLVEHLAGQAGLVLRNVRLTEELLARLEELQASRQRLVAAQDEERRKLERNIHDGAQQQLVALSVKTRLAQQLAGRDPAKVEQMLEQIQANTNDALENLRDLARGIYPPLLADKGLVAALEAQARKAAVPTTVDGNGLGRFGQDVEAAVYFSCLEALQNVAKYADATRATIALSDGDGMLRFTVTDDGAGFDRSSTSYGTGLQGIADRLAALDGTLVVKSEPGSGTALTGQVPTIATRETA